MKSISILLRGIQVGYLFAFFTSILLSIISYRIDRVAWGFLTCSLFFFFLNYLCEKVYASPKDNVIKEKILSRIESIMLFGSIFILIYSMASVLVTFNEYWLAKDVRFISIALGLPILLSILYWTLIKRKNNTN